MISDTAWQILFAESGRRDREYQARIQAWRDGHAAAASRLSDAFACGRAAAIAEMKHDQHDLVRALSHATLWIVRGEKRTRHTYARPHPQDYQGGPVQW